MKYKVSEITGLYDNYYWLDIDKKFNIISGPFLELVFAYECGNGGNCLVLCDIHQFHLINRSIFKLHNILNHVYKVNLPNKEFVLCECMTNKSKFKNKVIIIE